MANPTQARVKFEAELFAQKVNADPTEFICVDHGADFGRALAKGLAKLGWTSTEEKHSICKVATFEANLKKGGKRISVTSSYLMGPFTLIEGVK